MVSKILSFGVFASCLFGYSYSMEGDKQIELIDGFRTGQCYYQLDRALRDYSQDKRNARIFTQMEEWGNKTADVCILYHICRNTHIVAATPGVLLNERALSNAQNALIWLLVRVYIDVAACKPITEGLEPVYDLFKTKVLGEWYPQIAYHDYDFGKLVVEALKKLEEIMTSMPSPIWVCYCTYSPLSYIGLYRYTINFGDVDNQHDFACTKNSEAMRAAKIDALKHIEKKLQEIAAMKELSNQQKWEMFLNLKFSDI